MITINSILNFWQNGDYIMLFCKCVGQVMHENFSDTTLRKKNYQFFSDWWKFLLISTKKFTSKQILKKNSFDKNCIMFNKFCIMFDKNCIMFNKFCKTFNENCLTFNKICKKSSLFHKRKKVWPVFEPETSLLPSHVSYP